MQNVLVILDWCLWDECLPLQAWVCCRGCTVRRLKGCEAAPVAVIWRPVSVSPSQECGLVHTKMGLMAPGWKSWAGRPPRASPAGFPCAQRPLWAGAAFPSPLHSWLRALGKPLAAGEAPLSANSNYSRPELQGGESCAG